MNRKPWEEFFLDTMLEKFQEIKTRNSRFSVRSFAKMAGVSPAAMSLILKKNLTWSLSSARALEVLKNTHVDPDKINHFTVLCSPEWVDTSSQLPPQHENVFLTDPYYMPICLAFGLSEAPSLQEISASLNIPMVQVEKIVEDLIKLEYLVYKNGRIQRGEIKKFSVGDGPSSETIRKHHLMNLDSFRTILINGSTEDRDISSLIFTGNLAQTELVKKEIRDFYQRVHAIMNSPSTKDEVFKIFVGFLPLKMSASKES